jgi:protein-disulfide isomerase
MKKIMMISVCILLLAGFLIGQDSLDSKKLDAILDELRQIHKLLERPNTLKSPAKPVRIEVGKTPLLGSIKAPFTLVEFVDYQCKFCQKFYDNAFQDLKKLYIDTGKLRFYSIDLPLTDIHPFALAAAQGGRCAAEQEKIWLMCAKMRNNSKDFEDSTLIDYARELGLNVDAFKECLRIKRYKNDIDLRVQNAKEKGVRGTPSFVIGKSTDFGVEGEVLTGALPLDVFEKKLKELGLDK